MITRPPGREEQKLPPENIFDKYVILGQQKAKPGSILRLQEAKPGFEIKYFEVFVRIQ